MYDWSSSFGDKIILREGNKLINDTHEICEIFNTYFTSAAKTSVLMTVSRLNFIHVMDLKQWLISTVNIPVFLSLSKIYEKAMSLQLTDYFNHIFADLLSAFRKGYSCQSTLLNMIEHFRCALARGVYIACISMDISKAFGCLPDCLSICKLHAYGLSRDACTLIASYLYQRKQRVKIRNIKNEWKEMSKGVPQGSIFGPLILTFSWMIYLILWKVEIYSTTQMTIQCQ